jgi:hypothetical protein
VSRLSWLASERSEVSVTERVKGSLVTWRLYRAQRGLGHLAWSHARQLVRVERVVETPEGEVASEGNRYFVTNLPSGRLGSRGWLVLVRMHWRCENEGHWTADVVWNEDRRRKPWTTDPRAVYALSMLRMVALNIVAALRSMTRRTWAPGPAPWEDVVMLVRALLVLGPNQASEELELA